MENAYLPEFTYEQASEAFARVKGEYELETGTLAIIPEDRYEETFTIMGDHFTPDEPLCSAFGVKWHKSFQDIVHKLLRENMSVMMVSKETGEIMGVRISGRMRKTDDYRGMLAKITYQPLRDLFMFLTQKDDELDFYGKYAVEEAMHFFSLGVNRKFRRMGLGTKLMGACVALSRELGFKAIKGEGTSHFSQRIYIKYGFETLGELPYDTHIHNGRPLREGTGVHERTKIFGLKL